MAKIQVVTFGQAFKAQIVTSETMADLLVYVTKNESEARGKDEIWCFVERSADKKVQLVTSSGDVKIYYVDNKMRAKWKTPHPLQHRIG